MSNHDFLFKPGLWVGEGKVTFSVSPERLRFYTKWTISNGENGLMLCHQQVEMEGGESNVYNNFTISNVQSASFSIELSNDLLGIVHGKGVIDAKTIAWEFRGHPEFEGFEVYELLDNGDYSLHAEYSSVDQFRTVIDGRIWKKSLK